MTVSTKISGLAVSKYQSRPFYDVTQSLVVSQTNALQSPSHDEAAYFYRCTESDAQNKLRKWGYSIRGKLARYPTFLVRGERISAIACMSSAGLLDVKTFQGTANGETFYDFVQTHLLPHLMPYNGINPHSMVVLDNCSIHHVAEVIASIEDVGALVLFLPPYSPDLNPIKELFSKVKTTLKSSEFDMAHITDLQNSFTL